jgi:hypothetical protein
MVLKDPKIAGLKHYEGERLKPMFLWERIYESDSQPLGFGVEQASKIMRNFQWKWRKVSGSIADTMCTV